MVVIFPHHPKAAMNKMSIQRGYEIKCQWIFSWFGFPNTQTNNTFQVFSVYIIATGVSGNSLSRPFSGMKASDSRCWITGIDFFTHFPFPKFGCFFHSLPGPELWEWIFFIPFTFPNLPFHRRESQRELEYCERYQTSNIFSLLFIS